jgi:uncharacterized membrane protein
MLAVYNTLKFLHIAAVIAWIGGGFALGILNARLGLSGDRAAIEVMSRQTLFFLNRIAGPLIGVVLVAGIAMAAIGHIPPGSFWLWWGLAGVAGFVLMGVVLTGRAARELGMLVPTATEDDPRIRALRRRLRLLGIGIGLLMLSVVWAMVFKPTL